MDKISSTFKQNAYPHVIILSEIENHIKEKSYVSDIWLLFGEDSGGVLFFIQNLKNVLIGQNSELEVVYMNFKDINSDPDKIKNFISMRSLFNSNISRINKLIIIENTTDDISKELENFLTIYTKRELINNSNTSNNKTIFLFTAGYLKKTGKIRKFFETKINNASICINLYTPNNTEKEDFFYTVIDRLKLKCSNTYPNIGKLLPDSRLEIVRVLEKITILQKIHIESFHIYARCNKFSTDSSINSSSNMLHIDGKLISQIFSFPEEESIKKIIYNILDKNYIKAQRELLLILECENIVPIIREVQSYLSKMLLLSETYKREDVGASEIDLMMQKYKIFLFGDEKTKFINYIKSLKGYIIRDWIFFLMCEEIRIKTLYKVPILSKVKKQMFNSNLESQSPLICLSNLFYR